MAVALALAGCQEDPKYPDALQGVVELDERIVGFEVGGRLMSLTVDEGSRVEPDMVVAGVDDRVQRKLLEARTYEASAADAQVALLEAGPRGEEIRAMRARLDAAKAAERQLERTLARHRALAGGPGASPASMVDEVEARYLGAVAERQAIEQQLRALREGARSQELDAASAKAAAARAAAELEAERLARYTLHAPIGGVVVSVGVEPGEIVSPGVPVITIADTQHPYADVFVPQAEAAGIRPGTPAHVHVDALPEPLPAVVEYVEHRTEFTPRFVFSEAERPNLVIRVRVRIDDPSEQLVAGMPTFVYLER